MNAQSDAGQAALEHARALAEGIGPRGTGTDGEARAAEYVAGRLAEWGIAAERLECRTIRSMNHYPLAVNALGLAALMLYPLDGDAFRWAAAILGLMVAPFMAMTIRTSSNPLRWLLPKASSPSVLGIINPRGGAMPDGTAIARRQVVLLAHLDSNKCRLAWKPERLGALEPLARLTLAVQVLLGLLLLAGAILGDRWTPWLLALVPGAYLVGMAVTLLRDDREPYSPGANDNASSVGVALELACELSQQPLKHTQVWLGFTGAEETDHFGLRSILATHPAELERQNTLFIVLEGVGAGELVYATRHGIGLHYAPDAELVKLAAETARAHPEWGVRGEKMTMSEEVSTLTWRGYRAICICGRDPRTGGLGQWHRAEDTCANLSAAALERAKGFTRAMLERIDS